jgi:iron complex transport system substrate-binding protein
MQKKNKLTRRDFLAGSGALILTGMLAGCTPKTVTTTVNSTKTSTLISTITEGSNTTETVTETSTVTNTTTQTSTVTETTTIIPARTVVDDLNREVTLPDVMDKVLVLTKGMMDEVYEIGVVVVGKVEEYKNRQELIDLPSVGAQASPNIEAIYALQPDIIIANSRQHTSMEESLESTGATVIFVNPNLYDSFPLLGRTEFVAGVLNRQAEFTAYKNRVETLCTELSDKVAPAGYETSLVMMGGSESIQVANPGGTFGALLPSLGIANIIGWDLPGSSESTWIPYDAETIIQEDPDVILLKTSSNKAADNQTILDAFMANSIWQPLSAVANGKVFILPGNAAPGNMSLLNMLQTTAEIIYAEGF